MMSYFLFDQKYCWVEYMKRHFHKFRLKFLRIMQHATLIIEEDTFNYFKETV